MNRDLGFVVNQVEKVVETYPQVRKSKRLLSSATSWMAIAGLLVAIFCGCDSAVTKPASSDVSNRGSQKVAGTVQLNIVFNSDREKISVDVPCSEDSTVHSILKRAQNLGDLKFESSGEGESAFVKSIGGVTNLLGDGDNWVYKVNGELGDRSCGACDVKPGDLIQWSFGKYP
jgi:hypothetical protein